MSPGRGGARGAVAVPGLIACACCAVVVVASARPAAQDVEDLVVAVRPLVVDERAHDAAALRAVETERWEDALQLTLDLVGQYGGRPAYLARLAQIYDGMHREADEVAAWERFMAASPQPGQACPMIGKAYRRLGEYQRAIDAFERCLAADPDNVKPVYYLGLGHEWAGDFGRARVYYERAVVMAPPGDEYNVSIARLELHQGAYTAARDRAAAVLKRVPTHSEAALVAGLAEQRAGHRAGARVFLERAAELAPEYFDVRLALGILDYSDSRVAEARGHFEAAFLSDPGRRAEVQPWLDRTATHK